MTNTPAEPTPPPTRVRVTRSRRTTGQRSTRPVAAEIAASSELGEVYVEGLVRAQLRLSLLITLVAVVGIGGFPLLLLAVPTARTLTVFSIPFPWLVLGLLVYPCVWLLAHFYERQAARLEAEFVAAVERR